MWSSERVMRKHVRKRRCMTHLSFTRKIRGNLRVNGSGTAGVTIRVSSALNNMCCAKLQFERGGGNDDDATGGSRSRR